MPIEQVVPPPVVEYETDMTWPSTRVPYSVGNTITTTADDRYSQGTQVALFGGPVGIGVTGMAVRDGVPCGRWRENAGNGVARAMTGLSMPLALTTADLPSGFSLPAKFRVFRISWLMALTGNIPLDSGFHLNSAAGGAPGYQNFYIGIQGDGAGGWEYESNQTGGGGASETIALGAAQGIPDATRWTAFEIELQAATSVSDAQMRLSVNGTIQAVRSWGPGSLLPDYGAAGPANAAQFSGVIACGVLAGGQVDIAGLRFRFGRFTFDGLEIN